jgi:hypothetical protein
VNSALSGAPVDRKLLLSVQRLEVCVGGGGVNTPNRPFGGVGAQETYQGILWKTPKCSNTL